MKGVEYGFQGFRAAGNFDIMLFRHYFRCNISIRRFVKIVLSLLL